MSWLEWAGAITGVVCVWLTIRQHIGCWPVGIVMVCIYVVVFYRAKLYSDMALQVVYIGLQIYGWYFWLHGGARDDAPPAVGLMKLRGRLLTACIAVIGTAAVGYTMVTYTDAALPYWDASTTVMSLIAQSLMARKLLESWVLWIIVDVLSVGIYLTKELYPTSILYLVFLGMATAGLLAWRKDLCQQQRDQHQSLPAA